MLFHCGEGVKSNGLMTAVHDAFSTVPWIMKPLLEEESNPVICVSASPAGWHWCAKILNKDAASVLQRLPFQ